MVRPYLNFHLPYYLNSIVVIFLLQSYGFHGNKAFAIWFIYAILPILDMIIPNDNINPTPEESKILSKQFKWKIPIYLLLFAEWYALYFSMRMFSTYSMPLHYFLLASISFGHANAIGFLFAHELFHKKNKIDRALGTLTMIKSLYMHFFLEHIYGHHKYVSTPSDPATAKLNQSLYSFLYQTIVTSFQNSWNREIKYLEKRGKNPYSLENRMIMYLCSEILFTICIFIVYGTQPLIAFLIQAASGVFILETINYIRHYGLQRKEVSPGEYEQVSIKHSWNAPQWLQNTIFLKLQRHSDHHANSYKPYQCLLSLEESPNLPGGYLGCIPAAMVPPLWYYMINPIAFEANAGKQPSPKAFAACKKVYSSWLVVQVLAFTLLLPIGY